MEILIRKHTAKPVFHPHFNTATNRYYGTEREFYQDLKAKGLELAPKHPGPGLPRKAYKPSQWAKDMLSTVRMSKRADGKVILGDRFHHELSKKGVSLKPGVDTRLPAHYRTDTGGFYNQKGE